MTTERSSTYTLFYCRVPSWSCASFWTASTGATYLKYHIDSLGWGTAAGRRTTSNRYSLRTHSNFLSQPNPLLSHFWPTCFYPLSVWRTGRRRTQGLTFCQEWRLQVYGDACRLLRNHRSGPADYLRPQDPNKFFAFSTVALIGPVWLRLAQLFKSQ